MALIIYARVPVCCYRHLYAYKTRRFPKAHRRRSRICQPRESPERLRNFAVISRRVFVRLTNRRPARGRVAAGTVSKLSSSGDQDQEQETFLRSPSSSPSRSSSACPWHPRLILTRESHYFTHPFFLLRVVLTLSFIIVLAHRRPDPLSIRPVSPLA